MKKLRIAAFALASALLALPAGAKLVDTDWWNVDFEDNNGQGTAEAWDYQNNRPAGGVVFVPGQLATLTNQYDESEGILTPYASGLWTAKVGGQYWDESYITNGVVTNIVDGVETEENSNFLELNTQTFDLTWTPTNATSTKVINLIDANMRLVGSDSEPQNFDTNAEKRVQAAIYLKNVNNDAMEPTNSVLCVYASNIGTGKNEWRELTGDVTIKDGSWHRIQVSIDYTGGETGNQNPVVIVKVDGKTMAPRSGAATIYAANAEDSKSAGKVREVSFRGTGAVDNFVGKTQVDVVQELCFFTKVYLNGVEMTEEEIENYGWTVFDQANAGDIGGTATTAEFLELWATDSDISQWEDPEWCLDRIVLHRFGENATTETFGYHWNESGFCIDPDEGNEGTEEIELHETEGAQDGLLNLYPITNGATDPTNLIAEVYLKTIGLFSVYGETYVDGTAEASRRQKNDHIQKEVAIDDFDQLEFPTSFTTNGTTYVLKSIPTNANPAVNAPMVSLDGTEVYVNVDLYGLSDDVVVNAYYEEGSLGGKVIMKNPDATNGAYTFFGAVAMIGETPYETLAEAIAAAPTDGTTTNIVLLADVTQDSTLVVAAGKDFTLDLGGNEISAPSTTSAAPLFENWGSMVLTNGSITATGVIVVNKTDAKLTVEDGTYTSGNHAFRNGDKNKSVDATGSSITVNGGSITAQESCIAVKTADSAVLVTGGTLTSIDNAVISCNGTTDPAVLDGNVVTVTGGTLVGGITSSGYIACGIFAPNDDEVFFGSNAVIQATGGCGILVRAGKVTVDGGSITTTGNATGTVGDSANAVPSAAIVFDSFAANGGLTGDSAIEVLAGTFVSDVDPVQAVLAAGDTNKRISVSGGWFSDEVAADYVAADYQCVEDEDNAPNADAIYTVKAAAVRLWDKDTQAYVGSAQLSIADAVSVAEANGVDVSNRVFELILPLAAETYLIGSTNELFTVQTTNTDYTLSLTVGTSLASSDALAYTVVGPMTVTDSTADPPVSTLAWYVKADAYVAKIVNTDTTVDRFKTFAEAADVAVAYGDTVVMVADELAETYILEDGETLSVMKNGFLVPEVMPETAAYYIVETEENGVTTYASTAYLTATFLDGDNTTLDTVTGIRVGEAPATNSVPTPTKASEQAGHKWVFTGWTPSVETAITADQTYTPQFADALVEYTLSYDEALLAGWGASLPEGTDNPTVFTIETETFALATPVYDETAYAFLGWSLAGSDPEVFVTEVEQGTTGDIEVEPAFAPILEVTFLDGASELLTTNLVQGAPFEWPLETPPEKKNPAAGWAYTLEGWATNATDAAAGTTNAIPLVAVDGQLLYAVFSSNAVEFALVFDINGAQDEYPDAGWGAIYTPPWSYTVESPDIAIPNPTNSEDYAFAGWLLTTIDGDAVDGALPTDTLVIPHGSTGARTYLALWDNVWKVGFTNGRAVLEELATNVVDGTQLAAPVLAADPEYTDAPADGYEYHFAGWALPGSDEAVVWPQTITNDVNYHAVFTSNAVAYTLAFDLNSETAGWGAIYTPPLTYTVEDEDISIPAPTNTPAWTFTGWRLDTLDGEAVDGAPAENPLVIAKGSTGNRAYVAVWEAAPQEPDPVDPGTLLDPDDDIAQGTLPVQIEPDPEDASAQVFTMNFRAPQAGVVYQLMAADSCDLTDAQWKGEAGTADDAEAVVGADTRKESTSVNQLITLKIPIGEEKQKFYKIKATYKTGD